MTRRLDISQFGWWVLSTAEAQPGNNNYAILVQPNDGWRFEENIDNNKKSDKLKSFIVIF